MQIAVIGVGLIGGSVGLAARERLTAAVTGYDPDGGALRQALERGAIDSAAASPEAAAAGADAVFVAAPVGVLAHVVGAALRGASEDAVVTDVGSTKRAVVAAVEDPRFIGGHPLAGAETAGVANARADLFEGATWYLTPTSRTEGVRYERLHRLLTALGARPRAIDAEGHDRVLATVSHLPHVLANVLVSQAAGALGGETLPATGPSFRDATRVAGAPTRMWTDIYTANADALGSALEETIDRLRRLRDELRDPGAVARWNDEARDDRRRLLEADLAGGEVIELRVPVPNRPGVVAEVALALGRASVNIVDMGLHPAADGASGTIALWVAGEEAAQAAERMVSELGHPVVRNS